MKSPYAGLVVWDVDGTLIPADLRWLRRAVSETFQIAESEVVFPSKKVHGYTDDSIVVDTAIESGMSPEDAEAGVPRFHAVLAEVMSEAHDELRREQPPYFGAIESIAELDRRGYIQTVLTGNLRFAAEVKLSVLGLANRLDLEIGGYGSDCRDRFGLPAFVARRYETKYGRQLRPRQTVVIGDAPNDIACARHAGFWAIVVAHRASVDELSEHGPDAVLANLAPELLASTVEDLVGGRGPS